MANRNNEHPSTTFLKSLYQHCDEGFINLRFLPSKETLSIPLSEIETIPAILKTHKDQDCYFAIATRINGDGPKADILQIPFLWVNLDLYKLTDKEKEENRQRFKNSPLKPAFTIDFGGGCYLLWILKEPVSREEIPRVENLLKRLASYFHGDMSATDASLRIPGSLNHKYPHTPQVTIKDFHPERECSLPQVEEITTGEEKSHLPKGWGKELLGGVNEGEWKREGQPIPSAKPAQENVKAEPKPTTEPKTAPSADLVTEVENPTILERAASPQAEDGHVDIANELVEALAKINLSSYESRILWVVLRKTYGWHKKMDQISITQFEKATGIKRWHVARTLAELVERKIVTRIGNSRIISYGFQKDYTKWRDVTKRGNDAGISRVSGEGRRKIVTRIGNRSLPKGVNTKETNKRKYFTSKILPNFDLPLFS